MVIANGFIIENEREAFEKAKEVAKGDEVRKAVMPTLCTMTYFVSDMGEMFGCQQMKRFCLLKPLKIERRYSIGCNIRYAVGSKKQKIAYMQYIMYSTFVSGHWDESLQLEPKDGNVFNYQLSNLKVKEDDYSLFVDNIVLLQHVYRSNFKEVAWYVRYVSDNIEFEDAKDIAANTFYKLCKIPYPYNPQNFIGLWKDQSRKRALDFLAFRNRYTDSLFFENGEERFGSTDKHIDIADVWSHIHGEKRNQTMRMFSEGMTPTEIAEELNCTLGTVSSCITRTIQHLQKVYKNDIAV